MPTDVSNTETLSKGTRFLLTGACAVILIGAMKAASAIVVPFLLALFISIICAPLLFWLENQRVPKPLATALVILLLLGVGSCLGMLVGTSLDEFTTNLPDYRAKLLDKFDVVQTWLSKLGIEVTDKMIANYFDPGVAMQMVSKTLTGLGGVLSNALLILLTIIFLLLEASEFPSKLSAAIGGDNESLRQLREFTKNLNRYLAIKTGVSLVTGLAIWAWLRTLGVDYPVIWGLLAFILNFVPNIGSLLASFPAMILAFVQYGPLYTALTGLGFLCVNFLLGGLIEPRLLGHRLGLSPLIVFLSLIFWGWVLGPVGMLLSVPITMIIRIALDTLEDTKWLATLLGSETHEGSR